MDDYITGVDVEFTARRKCNKGPVAGCRLPVAGCQLTGRPRANREGRCFRHTAVPVDSADCFDWSNRVASNRQLATGNRQLATGNRLPHPSSVTISLSVVAPT